MPTSKTTVEITALDANDNPLSGRRVWITLQHGGAGGSVDGSVIVDRTSVFLDANGQTTVDLYPNSAITPANTYYLFLVDDSTPTTIRSIRVPASPSTIDWSDSDYHVLDPSPPTVVPDPASGADGDVLTVAGGVYELAAPSGGGGGFHWPVAMFVLDVDVSGGSFSSVTRYSDGVTVLREYLVGLDVCVVTGANLGVWTLTESGACTDRGMSYGDTAGSAEGIVAVARSTDGVSIASIEILPTAADVEVEAANPAAAVADVLAYAATITPPARYARCGGAYTDWWANTDLLATPSTSLRIRSLVRVMVGNGEAQWQEVASEPMDSGGVSGGGGDHDRFEDALMLSSGRVYDYFEMSREGDALEWHRMGSGRPLPQVGGLAPHVWIEREKHVDLATGNVYFRVRSDACWDYQDPDDLTTWRTEMVYATEAGFTFADSAVDTVEWWVGRGEGEFHVARMRAWVDGTLAADFDPSTATAGATTIPDGVLSADWVAAGAAEVVDTEAASIPDGSIGTAKLADGAVTFAKQANMATAHLVGRATAGTGAPEALDAAAVRTLLDLANLFVELGLVDAKGDLLVGTAADTLARLAVGANGRILLGNSSEAAGMGWYEPSPTHLWTSGTYTANVPNGTSPITMVNNRLYVGRPYVIRRPLPVDRFGLKHDSGVSSAGSVIRLGLATASVVDGMPAARYVEYGTIDPTTSGSSTTPKAVTISDTLAPGVYYPLAVAQFTGTAPVIYGGAASSGAPVFPGTSGNALPAQSSVSGAIPSSFTFDVDVTVAPTFFLRPT